MSDSYSVRNCAEIGKNLQLIIKRLMANDDLVKLLYYTDKDPLSHDNLTEEQKRTEVFGELIKVVPLIGNMEDGKSIITVTVYSGIQLSGNDEFRQINISIEVFTPLTSWIIKSTAETI